MESNNILKSINLNDLLSKRIKPKEMILAPIIPEQGLTMLYAKRGIGKTHISLGIAYAVASGSYFLHKWQAPKPRKVLFIDGEMPAIILQERLKSIVKNNDKSLPSDDYLQIITPDLQGDFSINLSSEEGQGLINQHLEGVELVIIDNLSTVCLSGKENEGESWLPIQKWALELRKKGISILFIHHSGKNDQQRGTSRREDVLDTVITLKHPQDYKKKEGARFEIHYEKARNIYGDEANPFEVQLITENENSFWQVKDIEDNIIDSKIYQLKNEGFSQRQIAEKTGASKSKVNRILNDN